MTCSFSSVRSWISIALKKLFSPRVKKGEGARVFPLNALLVPLPVGTILKPSESIVGDGDLPFLGSSFSSSVDIEMGEGGLVCSEDLTGERGGEELVEGWPIGEPGGERGGEELVEGWPIGEPGGERTGLECLLWSKIFLIDSKKTCSFGPVGRGTLIFAIEGISVTFCVM